MRKFLNKTVYFIACVLLATSLSACSVQKTFRFQDDAASTSVGFTMIGTDAGQVEKAHEEYLFAVSEVITALSADNDSVVRFNAPEGEITEGEYNILGDRDKYLTARVNRRVYDATLEAKRLYALTDGKFNACSFGLYSLWRGATVPGDDLISIETFGVSNPLLIGEKVSGGEYYLTKIVYPEKDGSIVKPHTRLSFERMSSGYALDCAVEKARRYGLTGISITTRFVAVFDGNGNRSDGKWNYSARLEDGRELMELVVPGGYAIATLDVGSGSGTIGDLFVGGVIDCKSGIPSTIVKTEDGSYCNKSDYVAYAAVVAKDAADAQALCDYALATYEREQRTEKLKKNALCSIVVTRQGKIYVTGDAQFSRSDLLGDDYQTVKL